jgi:lysophospholipase L1-like esterase
MMRKIVACILVLMMILSLTPTAFAAISSVTVDQSVKTITQGDPAVFIVTVTNDNTGMARETTFSVTGNANLADVSSFNPATVDLGRNDSVQVELRIDSVSLSTSETYTFQVKAEAPFIQGRGSNGQNASSMTSGDITLVVDEAGQEVPEVTSIEVSGVASIEIPATGDVTAQYSATVKDQSGNEMADETVTWSLQEAVTGVSINNNGLVTVTDQAEAGNFTVKATSNTDTAVSGILAVTLTTAAPVVNSIEVTGTTSIEIPVNGNTTAQYSAEVKDQSGNVMASETVTWSLAETVTGVSIDGNGLVTVTDQAAAGSFTVVATSSTKTDVSGNLAVNLTEAASIVNSIEVTGTTSIEIPVNENTTAQYSAEVKDQSGNVMAGETVTWSLAETVTGVSIDGNGLVTVTDQAAAGTFTVIATSSTKTDVSGNLAVNLTEAASIVNSIEVTGTTSIEIPVNENTTAQYSAEVKDQSGNVMAGETVTWSLAETVTGVSIDGNGLVTVTDQAAAGTFTVIATSSTKTDVSGNLAVTLTTAEPPPTSLSYVALGDSLVTGTTGVSGTMTSYVHGFRSFLQNQYSVEVLLTSLAADGDASGHLLAKLGQSDFAATVAAADVITLAIGGNNVMPAARESGFWSIDHAMAEAGTQAFENEYALIIARIRELNPNADLIVMTLYNPYNSANQPTGYSGDTQLYQEAALYIDRINNEILTHAHSGSGNYAVADVHAEFLTYGSRGKMGDITFFYPTYSWWTWWFVKNTRDPHPKQSGQNLMQSIHQDVFTSTFLKFSASQAEYPEAA